MVNTLKNSSRAVSFGHVVLARGTRMVRETIGWLKKANWTIELGGGGGETKSARALAQDGGPDSFVNGTQNLDYSKPIRTI